MSDSSTVQVAIGLGSNIGDGPAQIIRATDLLRASGFLDDLQVSSFMQSDPVDCPAGAGEYTNAAAIGGTRLSIHELLELCLRTEEEMGRSRDRGYHADREIDIDILLYGDVCVTEGDDLVVPHPGMTSREFVLVPLNELAPDWEIPGTGCTVGESLSVLMAQDCES